MLTLNGAGLAAAEVVQVTDGTQTLQQVFTTGPAGAIVPAPIQIGTGAVSTCLLLFGTGIARLAGR